MEKLTRMQQRIYDYIAETIREQGYPPSVREIGDAVGLKSPSTVHFHLKHLAELGVVVGETVTIVSEISGNLIIQVKEARIALDKTLAMRIIVG